MRCPRCGGETDEKKNYCSNCGAELRHRDNSADETLRLPDLSGVPLGGMETRRRGTVGEGRRRNNDRPLKITLVICGALIVAALAVMLALLMVGRERPEPAAPFAEDMVDNIPSENRDDHDYDYDEPEAFDDEPVEEPEDEPDEDPGDEELEETGDAPEEEPDENDEPDEPAQPPLVIAEPDERDEE